MPNLKKVLTFTAISAIALSSAAQAKETLYFAAYGGSTEKLFKEVLLPPFEKKHNVDVQYVAGNSTTTLARLQAQKNKPEIDVALIDEGPVFQAISMGLCDTIDAKTYEQTYDLARLDDDKAIGLGIIATGLAYNTEYFEKMGWDAPNSWTDLEDPKFKKKLSVPPISNGYGLISLVMEARVHGGGEKNIDPGFDVFQNVIADNVLNFEPSSGKMSELFQNGEIALSVWGSGRVKSLADTGFPVKFAYPKEGAAALMVTACPVVGSDLPELSQELVRYLVSEEIGRAHV